jgi:hypothetical protein
MIWAYLIKVIGTLMIIFAICRVVTSPLQSNTARTIVATLAFLGMGLIAVISMAGSLSTGDSNNIATVAFWSGIGMVLLFVCISTKFGRNILANVIGSAVYDLLKTAFRVLVGVPEVLRRFLR